MNLGTINPLSLVLIVAILVIALSVGLVFTFTGSDTGARYVTFLTPITVALIGVLTTFQNAQNHKENRNTLKEIQEETLGEKPK